MEAALRDLDAELIARTPSPALRRIGAWLGTLLLRSMRSIHPDPLLDAFPKDLQQPLVYGGIGRVLGLSDVDTAAVLLHEAVTGPATAAVKLMHIDPFQAHGAIIDLAGDLDAAAECAAEYGRGNPADIPALSAPLSDFAAELHEGDNVRLFAS
jgi:urease accessory protein